MKAYLNICLVIFSLIVVSILCGCMNKTNKADERFTDISEETIDTLAELAKHIDQFEDVYDFVDGYARVKKEGKAGLINKIGNPVVECLYKHIGQIEPPYVVAEQDGGEGVIEFGGEVVCDFIYDDIHLCKRPALKELAIVKSNGRSGIINLKLKGEVVVPCKYDDMYEDDDMFVVVNDGKYGWIDKNGKVVISLKYENNGSLCTGFYEGLSLVFDDSMEKCGFIDKNGNQITELKYDPYSTGYFNEGFAVARELEGDRRWIIIDKKGNENRLPKNVIIETMLYSEGLVPVRNHETNKCGYVNNYGNLVIDYKYDVAENFSEGLARVSYDGSGFGFIDKRGEIVVPFIYGQSWTGVFHHGLARVEDSRHESDLGYDNVGYINKKGEIIISPSDYDLVYFFKEGMCSVQKNGKMGFVNSHGELAIPCVYDEFFSEFSSGFARVCKNGKIGFVDKNGNSTFDKLKE